MNELKPCTKCGENDSIKISHLECIARTTVACLACGHTEMALCGQTKEQSIEKATESWNLRPIEDALTARIKELEAVQIKLREVCERLLWLYGDENKKYRTNGLRMDGLHEEEHIDIIVKLAQNALKGSES